MMDLSANMDGCTVFSKIDLVKAFHQAPIAREDRQKTAVITAFGLFEYNYMQKYENEHFRFNPRFRMLGGGGGGGGWWFNLIKNLKKN
jgi:hypothetical protein